MQIGGGLGEEYMHAPAINVGGGGGKGGGGFLASILDILGINRQVAKGPKPAKGDKSESPSPTGQKVDPRGGAPAFTPAMGAPASPASAPPPPAMRLLDDADAAFSTLRPQTSKLGFSDLPLALSPPGSPISPENLSRYGYVRR